MFVYLNYLKNQNDHKYTHLLQIYVDFPCTDLFHGFHHVNVRHDLFRYFCIVYLSNNMSGLKNANFVDTVLQDLLHRY
jgi:hypothetical protein